MSESERRRSHLGESVDADALFVSELHRLVEEDDLEEALEWITERAGAPHAALRRRAREALAKLAYVEAHANDGSASVAVRADQRRRIGKVALRLAEDIARVAPRPAIAPPGVGRASATSARAFVAYAKEDAPTAEALAEALAAEGLRVTIDQVAMRPGEPISDFIRRAVSLVDVTVGVISRESLLSGWFGMEMIRSLRRGAPVAPHVPFVGCCPDTTFFEDHRLDDGRLRLSLTDELETDIAELDRQVERYLDKGLPFDEISERRTRLLYHKNHLGEILQYLSSTRMLDIGPGKLAEGAREIARSLAGPNTS